MNIDFIDKRSPAKTMYNNRGELCLILFDTPLSKISAKCVPDSQAINVNGIWYKRCHESESAAIEKTWNTGLIE